MNRKSTVLLTSAFLILAGVIFIAKPGAAIPDETSTIDVAALTAAAKDLPVQQFPAF